MGGLWFLPSWGTGGAVGFGWGGLVGIWFHWWVSGGFWLGSGCVWVGSDGGLPGWVLLGLVGVQGVSWRGSGGCLDGVWLGSGEVWRGLVMAWLGVQSGSVGAPKKLNFKPMEPVS